MIKLGLIWAMGKWGRNYISTINDLENIKIESVLCKSEESEARFYDLLEKNEIKFKLPPRTFIDVTKFFNSEIEGVIVASPLSTHNFYCSQAIRLNKHILCEKPFVSLAREADYLYKWLNETNLNCLINHIDLFRTYYRLLKDSISQPTFIEYEIAGNIQREDCSFLLDYGVHPLVVCLDLIGKLPQTLLAIQDKNYYKLKVDFGDCKARIILIDSPNKKRNLDVWEQNSHYYYNMINDDLFINKEDDWNKIRVENNVLPLNNTVNEFTNSIDSKNKVFNCKLGLQTVYLIEKAQESIKENGKIVEIDKDLYS